MISQHTPSSFLVHTAPLGLFGGFVKQAGQRLIQQRLAKRSALDSYIKPASHPPQISPQDSFSNELAPALPVPRSEDHREAGPLDPLPFLPFGLSPFDQESLSPRLDNTNTPYHELHPAPSVNSTHLNDAAKAWVESCSLASERLQHTSIEPMEQPIAIELTQSSSFAKTAKGLLEKPVSRMLERLSGRQHESSKRLSSHLAHFYEGPRAIHPDFSLAEPPHEPLMVLPALKDMSPLSIHFSRLGHSEAVMREAIVLHEAGHIEHWRRCPQLIDRFGLHTLPDAASIAVSMLALSVNMEPEHDLKHRLQKEPEKLALALSRRELASEFESQCLHIMQEGYADCYSALALGCAGAPDTRRWAHDLIDVRQHRVQADAALIDSPFSDYHHDSREALTALIERLSMDEGKLHLTRVGLHELCLACAAEGLCRWLCQISLHQEDGPLMRGFYAKCAQLQAIEALGSVQDFFALTERALDGPLGALLEPLHWDGARLDEIKKSEETGRPLSSDMSARVALTLAISLAEDVGSPRNPLTGLRQITDEEAALLNAPDEAKRAFVSPISELAALLKTGYEHCEKSTAALVHHLTDAMDQPVSTTARPMHRRREAGAPSTAHNAHRKISKPS